VADASALVLAVLALTWLGQVPRRVRALLAPCPVRRPWLAAVLVALLMCSAVTTVAVERTGDALCDRVGTVQEP
jgi:hypothetical protein